MDCNILPTFCPSKHTEKSPFLAFLHKKTGLPGLEPGNAETLDLLAYSLEKLEERLRDIIILHYYGGKKLKEIAEAMHMSYPNMKLLHRKALGQLKKDLSLLGNGAS